MKKSGFTLTEILLVMIIIGVIGLGAGRMASMADDSARYKKTQMQLDKIVKYFRGDERILISGRRVDWGMWTVKGGDVPASLNELAWIWMSPNPFVYSTDNYGNAITFGTGGAPVYTLTSGGSQKPGSPFATDIVVTVDMTNYINRQVRILCKDVNGTLLLGSEEGVPSTNSYHIFKVDFMALNAAYNFPGTLTMNRNGFFVTPATVDAGPCRVIAYPSDGSTLDTTIDWQPVLSTSELGAIETRDVVYPFGDNFNSIEVRFPGSVSAGLDL